MRLVSSDFASLGAGNNHHRPVEITIIAILLGIGALGALGGGIALLLFAGGEAAKGWPSLLASIMVAACLMSLAGGIWMLKNWARTALLMLLGLVLLYIMVTVVFGVSAEIFAGEQAMPLTSIFAVLLRTLFKVAAMSLLPGIIEELVMQYKDASGAAKKKVITASALLQQSNGQIRTIIASTPNSISYLSFGFLDTSIKGVAIDGMEPNVENINNGSYTIKRPFNLLTKGDPKQLAKAFIDFILSKDGQAIVSKEYIPIK